LEVQRCSPADFSGGIPATRAAQSNNAFIACNIHD
jgi:hypothetical protein